YRYTGQTDISVGSGIANRNRQELEPLIGFFVNTLVLRTQFTEDSSVAELLQRVRDVSLQAYAHQDIPFERLVEALDPVRELSRTPLFQVMFVLQNAPLPTVSWDGLEATASILETGTAKFDLTLSAREEDGELELSLEYRTELFDAERMKRLLQHYRMLLEQSVVSIDSRISDLEILSEAERQQLLVEWNRTESPCPLDKCVHELLEEQVARTPHALALVFQDASLSYAELNRRANQLAHYLRTLGVGPEDRVGICAERSPEMVVGLLAILKAGGAYVPLDPAYPVERLETMLSEAHVSIVLAQNSTRDVISSAAGLWTQIVSLDGEWEQIANQSVENPAADLRPDNLAYVMYTSGSTRQPKGIAILHQAIVRLVINTNYMQLTGSDRIAQIATTSFDAATFEIWGALLNGACVVVLDRETSLNPGKLEQAIGAEKITAMFLTTALFNQIARESQGAFQSLRYLLFGGEAVDKQSVEAVLRGGKPRHFLHVYGPTEMTTFTTFYEIMPTDGKETVPIGGPIANTEVYVLDEKMEPVPVGVVGELYAGGPGTARGYLNRPELTAEKFGPHPFAQTPGERLYRTGDRVRRRVDGNIEFIGRRDNQVKIRGFRIELGEIEAKLSEHPGVLEAVVIARQDTPGDKRLVAYVRTQAGDSVDIQALRTHLAAALPEYMVPAAYMQLASFPLTPNGKLDRKALPVPESDAYVTREYAAPIGEVESRLARIWAEVLNLERVGRHDNFFELGGHSLLATRLVTRLRSVFDAELSLRQLFESPTVEGLAEHVKRAGRLATEAAPKIERVSREQTMPLSPQQEQLWFLEQIAAGSTVYSLPTAVRLKGDLDKLALRLSLEEIVRRHEILRTSFVQVDGKPKQRFHETGNFELVERDLRETANGVATEERINREQKEEAASPFLLSQPNLFRAKLLRVAEQEHILLLTFHHLVFDGWSIGVMVNELGQLYKAYREGRPSPLPELPIQYADYAVWQREMMAEGEFVDGLEYWKKELEDLSELDLPSDHPRPAVQSFRGTVERWEMSKEASAALRKVSQDQGVTLFMTLLAGFQILLARYSGQRDIVVGSPIANRVQPELETLIGFFVNTLVLRGNVKGDLTVGALLQRTREVCLGAYAHQSVPFEHLVDELQPERDSSRSPLFQVMFALQNAPAGALQMHGVEISMLPSATSGAGFEITPMVEDDPEHLQGMFALEDAPASVPQTHGAEISMPPSDTSGARFDLTLTVDDNPEQLQGMMEYCTDLYERPTVRRMLDHYQQVLSEIARDPAQLISTIPLLSPAEREQLLAEWNQPYAKRQHKCLHELFEQQASRTPNALAVVHRGSSLTYAGLNQRANKLGRHLKGLGVGSEELVGILLPRCSELLVAMLGVLKAGAAYVLLDPADR
ncbi:MAG: amino acid adenylation domain-containing protein, partial [Candidatus Sulfotelmatobacter sp.]